MHVLIFMMKSSNRSQPLPIDTMGLFQSGFGTPAIFTEQFPTFIRKTLKHSFPSITGRNRFLSAIIYLSILTAAGCKDPDELGLSVLPATDLLGTEYSDTASVVAFTVKEDSLRTDELSVQLIGGYIDPYFGKSNSECYSEVLLQGTPSFSSLQVSDSLVLKLFYKGYYGDTNTLQTINVYRMTESMTADSIYYSNKTFTTEVDPLGTLTYYPMPNTPVVIDSDTVAPQLRIPISMILADSLVALNGSATYQSNEAWREYFKGIKIAINEPTAVGQGCVNAFDLFNAKMTLYYRDTSDLPQSYSWVLTGAKSNHFTHDYTGFPVGLQLQDSSYADTLTCLQGMAGLKTKFYLPYLEHLKDSGNVVVNRAQLKVTLQANSTTPYAAPTSLLIVAIDADGTTTSFPADYYEPTGFFGGTISDRTYTFNLTRHANRILSGAQGNYGYYLVVTGSSIQASRAILGSGKNADYPIKLELYYTRISQ